MHGQTGGLKRCEMKQEKSVVGMIEMQVLAMKSVIHSTLWNSFITKAEKEA